MLSMDVAAKLLAEETGHSKRRCLIELLEARGDMRSARRELAAKPVLIRKPRASCTFCKGLGTWQSGEDCEAYRCPCTEVEESAEAPHSGMPVRSLRVMRDLAQGRLNELKGHEDAYFRDKDPVSEILLRELRALESYVAVTEELVKALLEKVP